MRFHAALIAGVLFAGALTVFASPVPMRPVPARYDQQGAAAAPDAGYPAAEAAPRPGGTVARPEYPPRRPAPIAVPRQRVPQRPDQRGRRPPPVMLHLPPEQPAGRRGDGRRHRRESDVVYVESATSTPSPARSSSSSTSGCKPGCFSCCDGQSDSLPASPGTPMACKVACGLLKCFCGGDFDD